MHYYSGYYNRLKDDDSGEDKEETEQTNKDPASSDSSKAVVWVRTTPCGFTLYVNV